ncbi:MAG: phosphatase PAP2 family protein [Micrococcales bacterium]|nr:phosphatase PAP2 family protein [Micrococcales bacterium]
MPDQPALQRSTSPSTGERVRAAASWAAANAAFLAVLVLGGALVAFLTAVAGEIYEQVAAGDGVERLDRPLLDWILGWRSPGVESAVTAFTHVGGPYLMPALAVVGAVGLALWRRTWSPVVLMAVGAGGSLALTLAGKELVGRARPPLADAVPPFESSPSFPSGHTLNATVVAVILLYAAWPRLRHGRLWLLLAAAFAGAMGLSRVVLGLHWLSDVMAGWALGLGWAAFVVTGHLLLVVHRRGPQPRWHRLPESRTRETAGP